MPPLAVPEPFDFELSTTRYRAFGRDLANVWHDGGLHRAIGGREVRIESAPGGVSVEPLDDEIAAQVGHMLGLAFDVDGFREFAGSDPLLASVEEQFRGLRPPLAADPFEMLVGAITAQQVSLFAAAAIRGRMIERFGERHGLVWSFPTPERLARARQEELTELGFSRRKAEYVLDLARSPESVQGLGELPDDEVKVRIVALRGLGEWTADWFLARHLARPRAWPAGDLALRKAASAFYGDGNSLSTEEVRELAPRFDPFQNLTAHYLLAASLSGAT